MDSLWQEYNTTTTVQLPESPRKPMEFLSRSWSDATLKTLHSPPSPLISKSGATRTSTNSSITPDTNGLDETVTTETLTGNTFSFASSATSQLVLERIMSQSDLSPLASGRLSHSSGPLNPSHMEETDSPHISPSDEYDDVVKFLRANNTLQPLFANGRSAYVAGGCSTTPAGKTVGRWLKERREKKKEETRAHNAQLHAAVSVAGVAAAVATIAAATAAASASSKDEHVAKTNMAVASAATLVAAQCVEAAEAMGAEREHLVAAVSSAVNVKSHGDILTLTAAAATALRGAATLKARALKEVWNIAAVIPVERGLKESKSQGKNNGYGEQTPSEENFLGICNQELLARGSELLKRTRNGDLHWKIVSVYIHRTGQVMLKMKSKHVGSTITKKKKNVVLEVCKNMSAWPGRHLFDVGEERHYFGLRTVGRGLVEFECRTKREYDMWTQGVSRLLAIVEERKSTK
ncbi:VAN3-binding protein-like [Bidens hawaiensis]|uniref:VAN3-binding protein-like n=1 Tax=Bidens hawaiensis TaxID=980011 RepID=UPI00404B4CE8